MGHYSSEKWRALRALPASDLLCAPRNSRGDDCRRLQLDESDAIPVKRCWTIIETLDVVRQGDLLRRAGTRNSCEARTLPHLILGYRRPTWARRDVFSWRQSSSLLFSSNIKQSDGWRFFRSKNPLPSVHTSQAKPRRANAVLFVIAVVFPASLH